LAKGNKLKFLSVNEKNELCHSYYDATAKTDKVNALASVKFAGIMDMPATTFTTVRGRGSMDSAKQ
jgi:hypothetical protein